MVTGWELDDTGTHPSKSFVLPKTAKTPTQKQFKFLVSSKDLAPVLYNICDLSINGLVKFAGDEAAMTISFVTKMGSYTIAFPTTEKKKKEFIRNATHFVPYAAKGKGNDKH